jgi:hypothetical protein
MAEEIRMTIHFTDGSQLSFAFPRAEDLDRSLASRIEALFKHQYLMLEVDGSVMLFPLTNIKYIQAHPAPDPLPANIIRGAQMQT